MSVLVTGGAGFIGSHFIERLLAAEPEAQVVCLDDFNDFYDPARKRANVAAFAGNPRVTIVEQSFCDPQAVEALFAQHPIREVVHLGAYAGVRASLSTPGLYEQTNVIGTRILLEAARRAPLDRFILMSSSTVYGPQAQAPFVEDAPLGVSLSPYGCSKRAAELLALDDYRRYGVPVVCLRPFSVYGSRIRPDLAMAVFASAIVSGEPVPVLGDGTARRDFTHVSDVCDGLLAARRAEGVIGEAINLGHHEPVAIGDLLEMLEQQLDRLAVIDQRPAAGADMRLTCADLTKAARLLGYRPRVPLAAGVAEFIRWFRESQ